MKSLLFPFFIFLMLLSASLIGCKSDSTTQPPPAPKTPDFTLTYLITGDTCWFYFTPNMDVKLDSFKTQYQAQSYTQVWWMIYPETRYVENTQYRFFGWSGSMPRPADWKFTFWGRKYSDNSAYTITKDFTVP